MANIPANPTAILLKQGGSITGSFAGFSILPISTSTPQGQVAHFNGLRDGNGSSLMQSGSSLFFTAGQTYPIFVTSASLDVTSANVLFYT
jgi:hypothetical protein